jgi:flagellar basal-body rod modification protein FlgD
MDPMDTSKMTEQLFAINNVEQQLETNQHLTDIKEYFAVAQNANYLAYIGKIADYPGNEVLVNGNNAKFSYEVKQDLTEATIEIMNDSGVIVHKEKIYPEIGKQSYLWKKPDTWPEGKYKFNIKALDLDGNPTKVDLFGSGIISGIVTQGSEKFFEIDNALLPYDKVTKISAYETKNDALLQNIETAINNISSRMGTTSNDFSGQLNIQPDFNNPEIINKIMEGLGQIS